jgi:hypothetical protein
MGSGGIASSFLALALDGGEWSASRPQYPLYWGLDGSQNRPGYYGEEKSLFSISGNRTPTPRSSARSLVDVLTELSRLLDIGM